MWNDKQTVEGNIPKRLSEIYSTINQMCQFATQNNINQVIVAGDVNDTKNVVNALSFILLKEILESFSSIDFHIIHGNHDSTARIDQHSAIELLRNETNIYCYVSEPHIMDDIVLVPYRKDLVETIESLGDHKVLVSHFGVNEARLSNGESIRSTIGLKSLRKFDKVILGHYHKPQELENVWYCGSPIQMRRDEIGEEKRFLVLDTDTLEIESIPTQGYRKYFELIIDNDSDVKEIMKQYESLKDDGHYVHIRKTTAEKVALPPEIVIIEDFEEEYRSRGINTAMSLTDQMKRWLEIQQVDDTESEEYINVCLEAIED